MLDNDNVVGLDFDENGLPVEHGLSRTDEYYSGCVLTILDGPCRGSSVRVVEYDYMGLDVTGHPDRPLPRNSLRVGVDGRPLEFSRTATGRGAVLEDFVALLDFDNNGSADLDEIRGDVRVLVNGRPLNGTGAGFDAYARPGHPCAGTAVEQYFDAGGTYRLGLETALHSQRDRLPNIAKL